MTNLLKLSAEARADFNKEKERIKEEQEWQKKALVDKWMQDSDMIESVMLKAIDEVSWGIALALAESSKQIEKYPFSALAERVEAIELLVNQIRKELEEQAEEHLYG